MTSPLLPAPCRWVAPLAAAAFLLPVRAWALPPNLLDWPDNLFGLLFAALASFTITMSLLLRIIVRDTNDAAPTSYLEPITVGYLAGGPDRAFLIALLELMEAGDIRLREDHKIELTNRSMNAYNPYLTQLRDGFSLEDARRVNHSALFSLRTMLVDDGLILNAQRVGLARLTPILLFGPVIAFGLFKVEVGQARHNAVGVLAAVLVVLAAGLVALYCKVPWRTLAGDKALKRARRTAARPDRPGRDAALAHAVALKGVGALKGTAFAGLATAIAASRRVSVREARNRKAEERQLNVIATGYGGGDEATEAVAHPAVADAPIETVELPEHETAAGVHMAVEDMPRETTNLPEHQTVAVTHPAVADASIETVEPPEHQTMAVAHMAVEDTPGETTDLPEHQTAAVAHPAVADASIETVELPEHETAADVHVAVEEAPAETADLPDLQASGSDRKALAGRSPDAANLPTPKKKAGRKMAIH